MCLLLLLRLFFFARSHCGIIALHFLIPPFPLLFSFQDCLLDKLDETETEAATTAEEEVRPSEDLGGGRRVDGRNDKIFLFRTRRRTSDAKYYEGKICAYNVSPKNIPSQYLHSGRLSPVMKCPPNEILFYCQLWAIPKNIKCTFGL